MAKNILEKKKRIAHFQRFNGLSGGDNDYVSSIIQSMDSNFDSIHLGGLRDHLESVAVSIVSRDDSEPSKCVPQNPKKTTKFTTAKKFPLMEKSQKILKQLKHNRKMPKPRAHMAQSPLKRSMNCNSPVMPYVKKKKKSCESPKNTFRIPLLKNSSPSSSLNKKDLKLKEDAKLTENVFKKKCELKNFKATCSDLHLKEKEIKDTSVATKLSKTVSKSILSGSCTKSKGSHTEISTFTDSNILKDSEGDTTDSEYERFVKKSTKNWRKKNSKKQNATKRKACTRKSQRKAPKIDPVEKSNTSSHENKSKPLSNISKKTISCANPEIMDENIQESEPDGMLDDVCTRDSSESDMEDDISPKAKTRLTVEEASSVQCDADSSKESVTSEAVLPVLDTCKSELVSKNCATFISCSDTIPSSEHTQQVTIPSSVNNSSKHVQQVDNALIIDLCDSDDCDDSTLPTTKNTAAHTGLVNATGNSAATQNVIHSESEDSDIEVIEIKHVADVHVPNKIAIKTERCRVAENVLSPVIKIEKNVPGTSSVSEAVYTTNICTKVVEQSVSNQTIIMNNECSRAIKIEAVTSSSEIVLSVADKKIKTESSKTDSKESVQKLCDMSCTPIASGPKMEYNKFVEMTSADLLELYKREFDIYLEMKKAEKNVETSLKNLQIHQAEKVQFIRSLMNKYIVPSQASSVDKPNTLSLVNRPGDVKPPSLCLQASAVNDVKPCVNMLSNNQVILRQQHAAVRPKLEPETDQECSSSELEETQETLEEKCNVCGKEAIAACQRCAKVFFCSHECGRKFWKEGHENECGN